MTKKKLIEALASNLKETETRTRVILDTLVEYIESEVIAWNKVTIFGFGSFEKRSVASRNWVNPRTKEKIIIPALNKIKFIPSSRLKSKIN